MPTQNVDNRGNGALGEEDQVNGNSVLTAQFFCEIKTALKYLLIF